MSPGYESPYGGHRDLLAATTATTRQQNGSGASVGQAQASPASPPHSYSPIPQVYSQNGIGTRQQNGQQQGITINTSAPSPTLSAQSGSLHSPGELMAADDADELNAQCGRFAASNHNTGTSGHHHSSNNNNNNSNNNNGSTPTNFVQITQQQQQQQHHLSQTQQQTHQQQQQHHQVQQQQQQQHHHNQNANRELLITAPSSPPTVVQRVSFIITLRQLVLKDSCFCSNNIIS